MIVLWLATDPQPPQWFEHVTTHGMQRIRATLRLEGDELHIDTNSEARLNRVLGTLRTRQPTLTVIDEARRPAREIGEAMHRADRPSPGGEPLTNELDPNDPEVAAVLRRWPASTSRPGSTTPSPHWPGTRRAKPPPTPPARPRHPPVTLPRSGYRCQPASSLARSPVIQTLSTMGTSIR
jgi:hypothetical protein